MKNDYKAYQDLGTTQQYSNNHRIKAQLNTKCIILKLSFTFNFFCINIELLDVVG